MKEELNEVEHNNKSGRAESIGIPKCIEIKVEHSNKDAEVPKEGTIEKIGRIEKDKDRATFGLGLVEGEVDQ